MRIAIISPSTLFLFQQLHEQFFVQQDAGLKIGIYLGIVKLNQRTLVRFIMST